MSITPRILVIMPHPDDAEFGAAGSVARWVKEGKEVIYIVCTSGDKGTEDINLKPQDLAVIREKEQQDAAKVLGVKEVVFLRYPDTVITADPYRRYVWHRDHRITGQVVLDAIFPYARDYWAYPDLILEGLLPHKVKEILFWASEDPNYCSDITDTFEIKLKALRCHKSQVSISRRGSDIGKRLRERARTMAEGKGCELGETFHRVELP
jgi:LmbE family N-acetylglucosaminyl deacetylase